MGLFNGKQAILEKLTKQPPSEEFTSRPLKDATKCDCCGKNIKYSKAFYDETEGKFCLRCFKRRETYERNKMYYITSI